MSISASQLASARAAQLLRWPRVQVSESELGHHVRTLGLAAPALEAHGGELILCLACGHGQRAALDVLEREFLGPLERSLVRIAPSSADRQELLQTLRLRLLVAQNERPPRILDYAAKGSLSHWLQAAGVRAAIQRRREQHREGPTTPDELLEQLAASGELELDALRSRHYPELVQSFESALTRLSARQRTVLKLHVLEGLGTDAIGTYYGVHRTSVARWILQARTQLLDQTREQLVRERRFSPSEADSLIRALSSGINVSLRRFLAP